MKKRRDGTKPKSAPRVLVSYTHESKAHKEWVLKLATDLRKFGVDVLLDRWECKLGTDLTLFMEKGIRKADRVLLVCTPTYKQKANSGKGGVGYERLVVTGEIAQNIETQKFICIVRNGSKSRSLPSFAMSRLFIDFRENADYQERLVDLLRDIHTAPSFPKPPVGPNPFIKNEASAKTEEPISERPDIIKPPIGSSPFSPEVTAALALPLRRRLPETRTAITHKFDIAGHEGFVVVGLFEDGAPGEVQITLAKEGSTVGGLADTIAILTSLALQYGVPLEVLVRKFSNMRFEPSGGTKNPDIHNASSIIDYIFRWLAVQFIPGYRQVYSSPTDDFRIPGLLEELKRKVIRTTAETEN